ncbi:MAG: hypothetical protein F4Y16_16255 [Holophagales bacterium]|nr:hypothetical protein [Holophagales bacterium]MYH25251.1 hypothetical protein [Holophagales bacterium]
MGSVITVRDIDPGDKAWLRQEARDVGLSMEEYVRRLIHEKREKTEQRLKPSEVFRRHFGPERGVELPPRRRYRHKPVSFADDGEA